MNLQHVCYSCVVITTKLHWNYNAITMLLLRIALVRVWYTNVSRSIAHWFTITLQHVAIEFRWHAACASTLVTFTHVSVHTSTMRAYYIQPLIYIYAYMYIYAKCCHTINPRVSLKCHILCMSDRDEWTIDPRVLMRL
jgi:hypothetical protein